MKNAEFGAYIKAQREDKVMTGFVKRRFEDRELEIKTILEKSSQYYKDLTSLNKDAYLKVISVF